MYRILMVPFLILSLAAPGLATGKGGKGKPEDGNRPRPPVTRPIERLDPALRFIESNVTETLYHELGHALIDVVDIPIFGPEEFAVDLFSVVLMNRLNDERTATRMARDVAHAYEADQASIENAGQRHLSWDEHGSNMQRYYNLACLFYGARPDKRERLRADLGLPKARAETCPEAYQKADRAWGAVLDRLAANAPGRSITMDWILDQDSHLTSFVSAEVDRLNQLFVLPEPLVVSVIPCGQVNAFYTPATNEIIICTELSAHLRGLAR